jgi:hypothetical protein
MSELLVLIFVFILPRIKPYDPSRGLHPHNIGMEEIQEYTFAAGCWTANLLVVRKLQEMRPKNTCLH